MKEKLNGLVNQAHELNKQMYQTLLQIVQSHGGFIRTDDDNKCGMYAILMNDFTADVSDERILGVAVLVHHTMKHFACL
jgi:hypothetical protein